MIVRIAVGQISCVIGDLDKNIEKHLNYIRKAQDQNAQVVIFPELSLSGYVLNDATQEVGIPVEELAHGKRFEKIRALSKKSSVVFGFVEESPEKHFYNSVVYLENGVIKHVHRKIYLPNYGMFEERRNFKAGNQIQAFDTSIGRVGMMICEDAWHPSMPLVLAHDRALFMICSAASPFRGIQDQEKADNTIVWERQNRFYTKAHGCFYFFANRVGVEDGFTFWGGSELLGPGGKELVKAPYFEESLLVGEVNTDLLRQERIYSMLTRDENLEVTLKEFQRLQRT